MSKQHGSATKGWDITLPCKVGEHLFDINDGFVCRAKIYHFCIYDGGTWTAKTDAPFYLQGKDYGKTLFATEAEARKALKRRAVANG